MLSTNIYYITLNKLSLLHGRLCINACQDLKPLAVSASLMPWLEQQRTRNFQWKPGRRKLDVDRILKVGDWLCINSCIQESFPIMDNLARPVWLDGVSYKINLQEPFFGSLTIRVRPYGFIEKVLNRMHEYEYAILTIGSCTPGYSMCLMKKKESFYIFECH
ncbi:hypothetical protein PoB_006335200 [Plakobranchus ocellatus]|uniref:Uncharacterized protein n=1 Tax=Plakobranchus ocellatus TaxID=259542 RepID=A0AAV4CY51_9GAST|nr:hypothetical protein PoB_006335200 [Plakobranchus ocellatus]